MSNKINISAKNEYSEYETATPVLAPSIKEISWKANDIKYGKTACLVIEVEQASDNCNVVIRLHSEDWMEEVFAMEEVNLFSENTSEEMFQGVRYCFTPRVNQLTDRTENSSEIIAEVWLVYMRPFFCSKSDVLDCYVKGSLNPYQSNFTSHIEYDTVKSAALTVKKIIIVIDPGHGVKPGNVGGQARIYTHKVIGEDGLPRKDSRGNFHLARSTVNVIPDYVAENPTNWIIGNNYYGGSHLTTLDNRRCEHQFAHDIALIFVDELTERGYNVINTRTSREVRPVANEYEAINFRRNIATSNNADYFISLHTDGSMNFAEGGHVIYWAGDAIGQELAEDIFSDYRIITTRNHPSPRTDVGVIDTSNQATRKVLIEFGFITSPRDAKIMFTQMGTIVTQVINGLETNINRHYTNEE